VNRLRLSISAVPFVEDVTGPEQRGRSTKCRDRQEAEQIMLEVSYLALLERRRPMADLRQHDIRVGEPPLRAVA
jgi:hypothetical protein